jgi:HEPN domain-containing protein
MKNPAEEEGRRWIAEAKRDLDAAKILRDSKHFNLACFHAQQAAEKGVKAFLYSQDIQNVWGHSVANLLDDAVDYCSALQSLRSDGASLDKFYIPTRYPNGLPGGLPSDAYTFSEAKEAIDKAAKIIQKIESYI